MEFLSASEQDTIKFGQNLAGLLMESDIICLSGELGAGKTRLVKGIAKGLGINPDIVRSPTFVLMNIYEGKLPLYHFDFYRMDGIDGVDLIGYDEFFYGEGVSVIEWPQRLENSLPAESLNIEIVHKGKDSRMIRVIADGARYERILTCMRKKKTDFFFHAVRRQT